MRRNTQFLLWIFSLIATVAITAAQSSSSNTSSPSPAANSQANGSGVSSTQAQPGQAGGVLKASTRLVTVDVVATDSHGAIVRDLKPEDFRISDHGDQTIEKFAFIDKSASAAAKAAAGNAVAAQPRPKGFYTNKPAEFAAPPTVILLDSLNSTSENMLQSRRHMLELLKTLPQDTPVAVMILDQSLRVVQDFSSDPAVLRAAVDRAMQPGAGPAAEPQDDPNSLGLAVLDDINNGEVGDETQTLQDFEQKEYASQLDGRVETTVTALGEIAKYLAPYPGRKNLIWLSESFPVSFWPDPNFVSTMAFFQSVRNYSAQVEDAGDALSDAQVAVYPVDIRGLQTPQAFLASKPNPNRGLNAARNMASQIRRENTMRIATQQTMEGLADDSGGKTCMGTNDLGGCMEGALKDSSSYYSLGYYPQNIKWDGSFHTISLKVNRPGVKVAYRRGYFALDETAQAKKETSDQLLQDACQAFLPSADIAITAQAAPSQTPGKARYAVSIAANGLTALPQDNWYELSAEMGQCDFDAKGTSFHFWATDLSQTLPPVEYKKLQSAGYHGYVDVPATGTSKVRVAVLDEASGLVGAVDIVVRPDDFANLSAAPAPSALPSALPAGAPSMAAPLASNPVASNSVSDAAKTTIGFNSGSGQSAALDWSGDKLIYRGDLSINKTAPALFQQFYHSQGYNCDAGALVPSDANGKAPTLQLTFSNSAGQNLTVDLKGAQPEYSGTLAIDDTARPFFTRLWYLVHCQSPPQN